MKEDRWSLAGKTNHRGNAPPPLRELSGNGELEDTDCGLRSGLQIVVRRTVQCSKTLFGIEATLLQET